MSNDKFFYTYNFNSHWKIMNQIFTVTYSQMYTNGETMIYINKKVIYNADFFWEFISSNFLRVIIGNLARRTTRK